MTTEHKPHQVQREATAYEGDQPVTYEVKCSCGEVFDHIAPENAREQWREHARESNQHSTQADVDEIGAALCAMRDGHDPNLNFDRACVALESLSRLQEQYEDLKRERDEAVATMREIQRRYVRTDKA